MKMIKTKDKHDAMQSNLLTTLPRMNGMNRSKAE